MSVWKYLLPNTIGLIAVCTQIATAQDRGNSVEEITRQLAALKTVSARETDLRQLLLLVALSNIKHMSADEKKCLAVVVNTTLDDNEQNLAVAAAASLVAEHLQLTDSIDSLIRRITLPRKQRPAVSPIRNLPVAGFGTPAMAALAAIGEPAIPALTGLAADEDASETERFAAKAVLQEIKRRQQIAAEDSHQ